jgi:hypothetical protein
MCNEGGYVCREEEEVVGRRGRERRRRVRMNGRKFREARAELGGR